MLCLFQNCGGEYSGHSTDQPLAAMPPMEAARAWLFSAKVPASICVVVAIVLLVMGGTHISAGGGMGMGTVLHPWYPDVHYIAMEAVGIVLGSMLLLCTLCFVAGQRWHQQSSQSRPVLCVYVCFAIVCLVTGIVLVSDNAAAIDKHCATIISTGTVCNIEFYIK